MTSTQRKNCSGSAHVRRSVYRFSRRNLRHPFLEAFDLPDSNLSCPRRERSTTAPQSLALLNADEAMTAAKALADNPPKAGKVAITINATSKAKDIAITTGADGATFAITAPRDVEVVGWSDKIDAAFRKVARKK